MEKVWKITRISGEEVYIFDKSIADSVNTFVEGVGNANAKLKKKDSIYVMPKSMVTRDDVNYLKDNFQITQKRKNGIYSKTVLSKKYIESLFTYDRSTYAVVSRNLAIELLNYVIDNYTAIQKDAGINKSSFGYSGLDDLEDYKSGLQTIYKYSTVANENIMITHDIMHFPRPTRFSDPATINILARYFDAFKYKSDFISKTNYEELQVYWKSRKYIVTEDAVKDLITGQNYVDENSFNAICKMLSGTTDDVELGVITMANTNFSKNKDVLAYILLNNQNSIKYSKAVNSANCRIIKSDFRKFTYASIESTLKKLSEKGNLTAWGCEIFLKHIAKDISNRYKLLNLTINPEDIKLPEQYDKVRS